MIYFIRTCHGRSTLSPSAQPPTGAPDNRGVQTQPEPKQPALLAPFHGARPPAPAWFDAALADAPERSFVTVADARIEVLTWGATDKPGLLFLHGNGAHADWWSFIAPFFARDYRVAAMSWSGMGNSDHRPHYTLDLFVQEIMTVARAAGLFNVGKPVIVGHSFGGMPLIACAGRHGEELKAAVIVDSPVMTTERRRERRERRGQPRDPRPNRVYPTLQEALNRFRLQPEQPCENLYIADFIARGSLRQVDATADSPGGYAWKFDPYMWKDYHDRSPHIDISAVKCPTAQIFAEKSVFRTEGIVDYARAAAPAGSPCIMMPEAWHHIMIDQPIAFVTALRGLLAGWPGESKPGTAP